MSKTVRLGLQCKSKQGRIYLRQYEKQPLFEFFQMLFVFKFYFMHNLE